MQYQPGLHILSRIYTLEKDYLVNSSLFKNEMDALIVRFGLNKLGDFYHSFPNGGYTGVICLTESHVAVHTWPEYDLLTLDIYLSNCLSKNEDKARGLFESLKQFFQTTRVEVQEVFR